MIYGVTDLTTFILGTVFIVLLPGPNSLYVMTLASRHGKIDAVAAREGLALFAEHTADARANPGKHPNIDRLIEVSESGTVLGVRTVAL